MQTQFKEYIKSKTALKTAKVLLAISGGVDSMVLLDLMKKSNIKLGLAHVNFQLRGEESDKDQALVEKIARQSKVKLHLLKKDTSKFAREKGWSTQIAAREIRYDWFDKLMVENNYDYLVTAHHLDDSIETFFINLNRGTGIKGLGGIQETEKILRPLLGFTKTEIRAYAVLHDIEYREDASNLDSYYLRNWFRNQLLPLWKSKNLKLEYKMQENMQRIHEAQQLIEKLIQEDLIGVDFKEEGGQLNFDTIAQMKAPKPTLMTALEPFGFNYQQIENLLKAIENHTVGSRLLTPSHELILDRSSVYLVKTTIKKEDNFFLSPEGELTVSEVNYTYGFIKKEEVDYKNPQAYFMDAEKLKFPIKLRSWEEGDRIQPFGMKGSKLVSDVLIDQKVPLHLKEKTKLLLSQEQIIAVIGFKVSDAIKITENTDKIWCIQWDSSKSKKNI